MATASAIAIAAAYHTTVDPRLHPYPYAHPAVHGLGLPTGPGTVYNIISAPDQYEALLGRKLTPTPSHLTSRILYVPSHNDKAAHLPIYDFTKDYKETVQDEPIGSSRFKTRFGLMPKPNGDGRGSSEVSYLVDFEPLERRKSLSGPVVPGGAGAGAGSARRKSSLGAGPALVTRGTVSRRMLYGGADVGLTIPPPQAALEDGDVAYSVTPASTDVDIRVVASFPLKPTVSRFGSSRNAWFTFTVPSLLDEERTLQWQVHPVEHGLLRYTLVELGKDTSDGAGVDGAAKDEENWWEDKEESKAKEDGGDEEEVPYAATLEKNEHRIRAIYHNVGLGFSLSQPFSEGTLLLQADLDPELEAIIVASLLGLLWRARGEESKGRKGSKSDATPRARSKSEATAPVWKNSVGAANGEVNAALPERTGRRKSLIGKILGKK